MSSRWVYVQENELCICGYYVGISSLCCLRSPLMVNLTLLCIGDG